MFTEILEEKAAIQLLQFLIEELTFFIESNPKLLTRFAWFTFCLITVTVFSKLLLTEISSLRETEKEVLTEIYDEADDSNESCFVLAKIIPASLNRGVDLNQEVVVTRDLFEYHSRLLKGTLGTIVGIEDEARSMFVVEFCFANTYPLDSEITFLMPFLIIEEEAEVNSEVDAKIDAEEKNQFLDKNTKKSKTELLLKTFKFLGKKLIIRLKLKMQEKAQQKAIEIFGGKPKQKLVGKSKQRIKDKK